MKNIHALLAVVLLASAGQRGAAQEATFGRGPAGDLPPTLGLDGGNEYSRPGDSVLDGGGELEPMPEAIPPGEGVEEIDGALLGEPMHMLEACSPSYFESSGTWLRRGYWYAEADFLFLNRGWDRKGLRLGFEGIQGTVPDGFNLNTPVIGVNELRIRGERPGGEGVGRLKLGRFLFRDAANRDHLVEAGWYGGGEWAQEGSITASSNAGLEVSDFLDRVNPSFDSARGMRFNYESELNSAEVNYAVKQRMHRDQLVLHPSGEWVRKATPSRTYTFLAGARVVNLRELLDWRATDISLTNPTRTEDGFYLVETDNNLFGTQLGVGLAHETARWSIGALVKAGPYINRIDLNSRFQVGETTIANSGETNSEEDDLSFVAEAQLLAKWHLRPNVSLRAGLELLFIDSIALAPHQINFVPDGFEQIAASGDSVFLGTSFGVESHW